MVQGKLVLSDQEMAQIRFSLFKGPANFLLSGNNTQTTKDPNVRNDCKSLWNEEHPVPLGITKPRWNHVSGGPRFLDQIVSPSFPGTNHLTGVQLTAAKLGLTFAPFQTASTRAYGMQFC